MTASTGKRPRTILPWIDDVPRTVTQWARYLKLSACELLRIRIRHSGSLEQAVKDYQAGVNQPFSPRFTKGICKRGHKIEGDNIVYHLYKGRRVPRCKKCYRKEKIVLGVKIKPGRKEKSKCGRGLHEWTKENIIMKRSANGEMKRRCRVCLNAYQRQRSYNEKMGLLFEYKLKRGQTIEERIAVQSEQMPNGCVIWRGKTGAKGVPWVCHPSLGNSGRTAPSVVWELMTGKPVPDGIAIRGSCGNILCIARHHLREIRFSDLIDQKAAGLKRWKTRRALVKYLPHIRDIERYGMPRDFAKEAMGAYPEVVSRLTRRMRCVSADEIKEIAAEAAMEIVLQERKGKPVDNVLAFMMTTAKRRIIDQARTPWNRDRALLKGEHDSELERLSRRGWLGRSEGYTEDPMEVLMNAEEEEIDRATLKNRFNQLNDAPRRCYLLRAEGFNNAQVAMRLGITVHTVECNLQKAFNHLRITPTGQQRRPLFIPMDVTRHHYGLNNRKAPRERLEAVKKRA